jgi:mono/diheme cytochrome c family protein
MGKSRMLGLLTACLLMGATAVPLMAQVFGEQDYSGGELFERYCAACHGVSAMGDGPVAASLVRMVPDLTRVAERRGGRFPRGEISEMIDGRSPVLAHGTRQMPVWGREFWVEQGEDVEAERRARDMIKRLIDYLESIQVEDTGRR